MNVEGFQNWMLTSGLKKSVARSRVSNCLKVEQMQHVDLDICYSEDRCQSLIRLLTYSREDQRKGRPPRHNIPINGDIFNGTATYKAAVVKYVKFKDFGGDAQMKKSLPSTVPPRASSKARLIEANINGDEFDEKFSDFWKWLDEESGLTRNSANQYRTYIRKLGTAADAYFGQGWFVSLLSEYVVDRDEAKIIQCSAFIEDSIRNAQKVFRKAWGNWRSAFRRLEEYLHEIADVYNEDLEKSWEDVKCVRAKKAAEKRNAKAKDIVRDKKVPVAFPEIAGVDSRVAIIASYSHEDLLRAFKGRLKTQSRYYPKFRLFFPTRLLTKIFRCCRRNEWVRWLEHGLDEMRIIAQQDGQWVPFSAVSGFVICRDGSVVVTKNDGISFEMMTHAPNGVKIEKEFATRGLRDVSIDHVEPLEAVLRKNKENLHGLKRLTELIFQFEDMIGHKLNRRAEKDWVNDFYGHFQRILDTDEMRALIVNDLRILKVNYELMDARYNSIKSKSV